MGAATGEMLVTITPSVPGAPATKIRPGQQTSQRMLKTVKEALEVGAMVTVHADGECDDCDHEDP